MTGEELNRLLDLRVNQARYRRTGDWYHSLTRFPGILFDLNGYVVFETEQDYIECPQIRPTGDFSIKNGICSINNYLSYSDEQLLILRNILY